MTMQFWIAETRSRLEETVRMRLMSDVPLGMFLSGGVDSSAIAAIMKRSTAGPVKTFAVGYEEQEFSELELRRAGGEDDRNRASRDRGLDGRFLLGAAAAYLARG